MLMRLGCSSGVHLTWHWVWRGFFTLVENCQREANSSVSLQCCWDWWAPTGSNWKCEKPCFQNVRKLSV